LSDSINVPNYISRESFNYQISVLKNEIPIKKLEIIRPCNINDGILEVGSFYKSLSKYNKNSFEDGSSFIPASGSATRMFNLDKKEIEIVENIKKLPFFNHIIEDFNKNKKMLDEFKDKNDLIKLNHLLSNLFKKFSKKPKALIPFHQLDKYEISPLEEIILYNEKISKKRKIYFTVQDEHKEEINYKIINSQILKKNNISIENKVFFTPQEKSTNSICIKSNGHLLKDNEGNVHTQPSGHGALINNINDINESVFYIHNIDNITPKNINKRLLNHNRMCAILKYIHENIKIILLDCIENNIKPIQESNFYNEFIKKNLSHLYIENIDIGKIENLYNLLHRPIRVCGVVEDSGAKGGKPFWVKDGDSLSLQLVEESQIPLDDPEILEIWNSSIYFNPVEMVCLNKDIHNNKFDLNKYKNETLNMIVNKSIFDHEVKFVEKAGLWNGGMHHWITIFIKIDKELFTPVKNISDLFLEIHQP
tara:strand:- start:41174 stop:42610 length:1437 start_codon:yes stop_codon:yes gene_type:complete